MICKTILKVAFLFFWSCSLWAQNSWENPIQKQGRLGSPLVETSPFVFNDKLYLLENNQRFWDVDAYIGGQWETIAEGQSIGRKRVQTFDPVETNKICLSFRGDEGKMSMKSFTVYLTEK